MALFEVINEEIKNAMKSKNKERLEALRGVKSAFLLAKTEKGAMEELSEETELKVIQKLIKQRRDSAEEYAKQNRQDLADKENKEADIISEFMPKQMSAEELEVAIKAIIAETGAASIKEMGKVMGVASKQLAGKADGKAIADLVKKLLA